MPQNNSVDSKLLVGELKKICHLPKDDQPPQCFLAGENHQWGWEHGLSLKKTVCLCDYNSVT